MRTVSLLLPAGLLFLFHPLPGRGEPVRLEATDGVGTACAAPPATLAARTVAAGAGACPDSTLHVHHDGSFENGIAWDWQGVHPPYDGAFGEAYDLGPGTVDCVVLWLTQTGTYDGENTEVYVWDGGVTRDPGAVLALVPGIVFPEIPFWPEIGRFEVEVGVDVAGEVTVGNWGEWPEARLGYYWCVDSDGDPGAPWTYIADFTGWPPGWQHPAIPWGPFVRSMGIGLHFTPDEPVPTHTDSWGQVKALFFPRP